VPLLAAALLALAPLGASGQEARRIMEEAQKRTRASSEHYEGTLQVFDAKGKISDKRWTFDRLGSHGSSRSVLRFTAPPEVKGVALLVVNHPDRASDQWMWTPAIERDRRVALQDRSQRFFGTDFSFEDIEEHGVDQYDCTLLGDDSLDGAACWKIECRPNHANASQYAYSHLWLRKDDYVIAQLEKFQGPALLRRIVNRDVRKVQGIPTPYLIEISQIERRTRTELRLEKLEYNVPLDEAAFTVEGLRPH